jgi:hypothetical protein
MVRVVYTPIRARRGTLTHAITLAGASRTACGRACQGWLISARDKVSCRKCLVAMYSEQHLQKIAELEAEG